MTKPKTLALVYTGFSDSRGFSVADFAQFGVEVDEGLTFPQHQAVEVPLAVSKLFLDDDGSLRGEHISEYVEPEPAEETDPALESEVVDPVQLPDPPDVVAPSINGIPDLGTPAGDDEGN